MSTFNQVVESVKKLSLDEKAELQMLLEKFLIEERREEIYSNFEEARAEFKKRKPRFTSDINKLKRKLK